MISTTAVPQQGLPDARHCRATHGPLERSAAHLSLCDAYDHSVSHFRLKLYEAMVEASSAKVAKIVSVAFPAKLAGLVLGRGCA
jgi:hypothetical protein